MQSGERDFPKKVEREKYIFCHYSKGKHFKENLTGDVLVSDHTYEFASKRGSATQLCGRFVVRGERLPRLTDTMRRIVTVLGSRALGCEGESSLGRR